MIAVVISSKHKHVELNTTGLGGVERYHRMDLWDDTTIRLCTAWNDTFSKGKVNIRSCCKAITVGKKSNKAVWWSLF